jgi:hypothetical protein
MVMICGLTLSLLKFVGAGIGIAFLIFIVIAGSLLVETALFARKNVPDGEAAEVCEHAWELIRNSLLIITVCAVLFFGLWYLGY